MAEYTNQLIHEKSPYLLQHAHNPVDWHPWGEEAFDKARREDKLVLVSIGYATCHWCHVMERESFEDEALAAYLNDRFVAVKVDREERPDVDKIYMDSLHAMGIQGGWPLNMFTTPEGQPVAGGTYFPPDNRHGRMAFMQVLDKLHKLWRNDRFELMKNAKALTEYLQSRAQVTAEGGRPWTVEPIDTAVRQFAASFDSTHGGFQHNGPNKFPPSMGLMLLLRHHARTGDGHSLEMAGLTLRKMRGGGIYDQVGGGLSRYSTDHEWLVPHFEKMLYDNALFVQALVETHQATGEDFYREVAEDVLTYVLRDMHSPEGGFFSAEDADSDGVEGKFYVWKPGEVTQVVGKKDAPAVLAYWDITEGGNYEGGASIPNTPREAAQVAEELGMTEAALLKAVARGRKKMLDAKFERIRPLLDDKVLTSWNGLMISALAKAARAFGKADYLKPAIQAADFLLERLRDDSGRLLRRYRDGEARFKGYLVDHGQLAVACLDLYESTFETRWFETALELMREIDRLFRNDAGSYYDTGSDGESLIARTVDGTDGVEPSGNSAAALAALRLHAYGVRGGFEEDALRIFSGFRPQLEETGISFAAMLGALDFHLAPPAEVAIVGDPAAAETQAMLALMQTRFHHATVVAFSPPDEVEARGKIVPLLAGREAVGGKPTAYLCRDMACRLPVHTAKELEKQLKVG